MALTTQQSYNALFRYSEALKNTRLSYLRLLENPGVSEEDKNKIWAVSLILQYMIDNHKKYNTLLASLNKDKQALVIIESLFKGVTIDPAINLQGFIDQVQTTMQSEKFKSDLTELVHQTEENSNVALYSILGGISIFLLFISCTVLMPFVGPWALCAVGILFIAACIFLGMAGFKNQQTKIIKDPIFMYSLEATEPPAYGLTEEYCYQKENSDSGSIIQIKKTHQPESKGELRQRFFQAQMNHMQTLSEEVQMQFSQQTILN